MPLNLGNLELSKHKLLKELLRKTIHITIAFIPAIAKRNTSVAIFLLVFGTLLYIVNESARIKGRSNGTISRITAAAQRPGEEQGFVWGPVSLGLGALATLVCYPDVPATVGIYAVAFGDGIASIMGNIGDSRRVRWVGDKTFIGSMGCFIAVLLSSYAVLKDWPLALISGVTATALELIPPKAVDNLLIPLGTGLILTLLL